MLLFWHYIFYDCTVQLGSLFLYATLSPHFPKIHICPSFLHFPKESAFPYIYQDEELICIGKLSAKK